MGNVHELVLHIFQASVMVMSKRMLELWADQQFVLEYLALVLRILDGSRHLISDRIRHLIPATSAPIPFPALRSVHIFIAEQVAYYIIFACSDAQVDLLDREIAISGLNMEIAASSHI